LAAVRVCIALVLEHARDEIANILFIIDDQNIKRHVPYAVSLHHGDPALLPIFPAPPIESECARSRRRRARRRNCIVPQMLLDNAVDDGEAQAGALGPRRHIGFE
jgi:hypothetical protein